MRIFPDANVLFSASNRNSHMHDFVLRLGAGHSVLTSDYAYEEARRNISLKRPLWEGGFQEIHENIRVVRSIDGPVEVPIVDKDRPILATAIQNRCDYLVTGDKRDFSHLYASTVCGVRIVSPIQLARILFPAENPSKRG